jgi:hypothetical protein
VYASEGKQAKLMESGKNSAFSKLGQLLIDDRRQHVLTGRDLPSEIAVSPRAQNIGVILVWQLG